MTKRKKKPSQFHLQKIAQAHHKNEYFNKIRSIINNVAGSNVFDYIPKDILEREYILRPHSIKIVSAEGCEIDNWIIDMFKYHLPRLLKSRYIEYTPKGDEISVNDFFSFGLGVSFFSIIIDKCNFPNIDKVKSAVVEFANNTDLDMKAQRDLYIMASVVCTSFSNIQRDFYWVDHDVKFESNALPKMQNCIEIYKASHEIIHKNIEGSSRPLTRVGWAVGKIGVKWISIKADFFNIKSAFSKLPMDVYIQSHALQRLSERIDCLDTGFIHLNMYESLCEPKIFYNSTNKTLIEFRIFNTKAGYFLTEIIDGIVVIKTFLFVTNNGTPEGERLGKITGLQKLDKKYLAIDRLSTFMSSDFSEKEQIRKLLTDSGCECLLELYEKVNLISIKHSEHGISDLMINYIGNYNSGKSTETELSI